MVEFNNVMGFEFKENGISLLAFGCISIEPVSLE